MMTNYDVLMNSTEEECCKLLEEWKQSGIKAFDWLGANLAPGFTGWKDKNGKKIYEYDTLQFQGDPNEISSIYYYFVEMRKEKWLLKDLSTGKYELLDAFMAGHSEVFVHDD